MKKRLLAAAVAAMVTLSANAALAFPLDVTGDFRLQGRSIDDKIAGAAKVDDSWFQLRSRLNFSGEVDKDTTFFGRFSSRNNLGGAQTGNGASFDQYGVKINSGDWKLSLGRQAVNLGQGTIISTGTDAVGVDNKFDGLVASTKSGVVDLNLVAGKTNDASDGSKVSEWYGIDASTKLSDKVTAGVAYASEKPNTAGVDSLKVWSVNTSAALSKNFSLNAEYAKSDADTDNSAYFIAGTYSKNKDSFTVQYNNVEGFAVDQYNSGIGAVAYPFAGVGLNQADAGYKGLTYVYSHNIKQNLSAHVIYMDLDVDGLSGSDKELAAGLVWGF